MRQRITYLLPGGTGVNPTDITVTDTDLRYANADSAAEERRITIGLSELPKELQSILEDFHELHVRLVSPRNYHAFSPTLSRLPAGFHVFFTPQKPDQPTTLCSVLKQLIGESAKCSSSSNTFSRPPILSERFAQASSYQFFHGVDDLPEVSAYIGKQLCPKLPIGSSVHEICNALATAANAAYVDYDYDVISHAVTVTILSTVSQDQVGGGRVPARKLDPADRLEVGVLAPEAASEPEELKLGGYLTVVGDDDKPGATLFSFPSRHHASSPGSAYGFTLESQQPTGLHPNLDIMMPAQHLQPPKDTCKLHAYLTLPSPLFLDRFQLSDDLFLRSRNIRALRTLSGEQDLEAPDWAVQQWGSAALLELAPPVIPESGGIGDWRATIPTHLRYVNGSSADTAAGIVEVSWPVLFWACEAEEGLKMSTNPFDRVNMGYDGLFGPKTMFYHIPPGSNKEVLVEKIPMPVIEPAHSQLVSLGTSVAVLTGFLWICWKLFGGNNISGRTKVTKKSL